MIVIYLVNYVMNTCFTYSQREHRTETGTLQPTISNRKKAITLRITTVILGVDLSCLVEGMMGRQHQI